MDLFDEFLKHPDVVRQPRGGDGEAQAWCPWHPDKAGGNPSLGINTKKKIVKCFVCEKGGVKALAEAWGITQESTYQRQEIEQAYDYRKPDGTLLFQVVRFKVPPGEPKKIVQRRPDPEDPNGWAWNLKGVQTVLYRLPELRTADPAKWVWIVEGEKDVDRLRSLGLVATTNPQGAGKWRSTYNKELRNRQVAVIPDNDNPGVDHAVFVAKSLQRPAVEVKIIHLPGLEEKGGDVSDWLDAGHALDELQDLLAQSLSFEPEPEVETIDQGEMVRPEWTISRLLPDAQKMTSLLNNRGYFVNGSADSYFFDQDRRQLVYLEKEDLELRTLLGEDYSINRNDTFYPYLVEHLLREAHVRGRKATVRQFSHYDPQGNTVYLDMGASRVLRITRDSIDVRENGADGVLFLPMPDQEPWDYNPGSPWRLLYDDVVNKVNFSDEGAFTVQQQRILLLLWLLSMAFESVMPTKIIAMAIGPGESGKSSLYRTCGQILIGPNFEVDGLLQDTKGEEDFWINLSHSFFVCYDNVDQYIRWLPDAMAQVATGVRRSRRQLHTTSTLHRSRISCMLAVTARTPTVSLRREDVAGRSLVFTLKRLETKRAEYDIQGEIKERRADLLSDYAKMVQKALGVPLDGVEIADPGMRMADFARVATRIGKGLGQEMGDLTDEAISAIRSAQNRFAIEEDHLSTLLELWLGRSKQIEGNGMDLGEMPNEGRAVLAKDLQLELQAIAKEFDIFFKPGTPKALGRQLQNLEQALSQSLWIERKHTEKGSTWRFHRREGIAAAGEE